jgi:RNA polymerase sigma-70 factor, ECF subfamily
MPMTGVEVSNLLSAMLPRLWRFALRLADGRHDAESLVQVACADVLKQACHLQPENVLLRCMSAMLKATRAAKSGRASCMPHRNSDSTLIGSEHSTETGSSEQERLHGEIVTSVLKLPELQRIAMLLVAVEGLSYSEAAIVLDMPVTAVVGRVLEARLAIGMFFVRRNATKPPCRPGRSKPHDERTRAAT